MSTISELAVLIEELKKEVADLVTTVKDLAKDKSPETDQNALKSLGAKIIKDISDKIDQCECTDKLFDRLKGKGSVIPTQQETPEVSEGAKYQKYSWPNHNVGNPELGSSGVKNPVYWPPTSFPS
ncbi:ORFIII [Mirabilis mosaic virus]|uniref:Virion-associated protein n=1 Tax=Mirabilis mosaic virus TaxID=194445 RepID=Q8JTA4_9VIRU|nr:hypothetical protein [Mirabilis mosaic virus]AAM53126.1 ORFIII [Mirabilis mosaic virus]